MSYDESCLAVNGFVRRIQDTMAAHIDANECAQLFYTVPTSIVKLCIAYAHSKSAVEYVTECGGAEHLETLRDDLGMSQEVRDKARTIHEMFIPNEVIAETEERQMEEAAEVVEEEEEKAIAESATDNAESAEE